MNIACSVIVPVRNEAGNIKRVLETIPTMGDQTEVIFVEGNSTDNTWETLIDLCYKYAGPHRVSYHKQSGCGKWDAVEYGFSLAHGDVLVILDGDLAVRAEELPTFYEIARMGKFVNGSRLRYKMEREAMRPLNRIGNIIFAKLSSLVIGYNLSDSLCGTKAMKREDYLRIWPGVSGIAGRDPFGDHTLIFGAAMIGLEFEEVPIHYRARTYGSTNISRFSDGWKLFKLMIYAFRQLRLYPYISPEFKP